MEVRCAVEHLEMEEAKARTSKSGASAMLACLEMEAEAETISYEKVSFNNHVMPILSDKCFHCHGPDASNQESDYRLDTEENAKKALEEKRAISRMYQKKFIERRER